MSLVLKYLWHKLVLRKDAQVFSPSSAGMLSAHKERKIASETVNIGKKEKLPLNGVGGWQLMRKFLEIFYRLLDGKF